MKAMKRAGMTNEAALAQAEANALTVEASTADLRQQIRELENNFSVLLGNMPQRIAIDENNAHFLPMPVLSAGIPVALLANRPDVRQAENTLKAAFYATNAARSAFYPSITLGGSVGWTSNSGGTIVNPAQVLTSAVGSLVQPLFAQGRLRAQLKIARAQQEEARLLFAQSLLDAGAEVNNALSACQTAHGKRDIYDRRIARLEDALRSTQLLMQNSSGTSYLEVLTAQQSLLDAELMRITNEFEEFQSIITLYRALGGGTRN